MCFLHDFDMSSDNRPSYVSKSLFHCIWGNLLGSVQDIIGLFEKYKRLGFILSPQPYFGPYFNGFGKDRTISDFWVRMELLNKVQDINNLCGENSYKAVCKEYGFFYGTAETKDQASMREVNYKFYLDYICNIIRKQCGDFLDYKDLRRKVFQLKLETFIEHKTKIYVYGTGILAKKYSSIISNIFGYIVSDDQYKLDEYNGKKVYYLSEAEVTDDDGILVCVDDSNQLQILEHLKKKNIKNYLCI